MTNGDPTAQQKLASAVADSSKAPEPSLWVRIVQMAFAGLTLGGAIAVALILSLQGPPPPKEPESPEGDSGSKAAKTASATTSGAVMTYVAASGDESVSAEGDEGSTQASGDSGNSEPSTGTDQGSGEGDEGGQESEGSTADSLANLNEQAPWAFAIVALLVSAFIATGKSLNFSGTKQE